MSTPRPVMTGGAVFLALAVAGFLAGCAATSPMRPSISGEPQLPYRDYMLAAGRPSPAYAELVSVRADGSCDFRFHQPSSDTPPDGYFRTSAKPGEQIDGGASDFYGRLLNADYSRQAAAIRVYDLADAKCGDPGDP